MMDREKYTHVCSMHEKLDLSRIQPIKNRNHTKPCGGIWLSIDGDWERWCKSEQPDWLEGKAHYEVTLSPSARILRITSAEDLNDLPRHVPECLRELPPFVRAAFESTNVLLDFEAIAEDFDVIEVMARSGDGLYSALYGWDCDSALVLNPQVIQEVIEVDAAAS